MDAAFEYVSGPMREGDEHPAHKGWFYTGRRDRKGVLLWYKPPSAFSLWARRIALGMFAAMMALGMFAAFFVEKSAAG